MTETTMKEVQLFGKLLPTHPDILPILDEIREKYKIKDIKPDDDSLKELLKFGLDIDWDAIHAEILKQVKETDLLPEKAKKAYDAFSKIKTVGLVDPELDKLFEEFKNGLDFLIDLFLKQYEPIFASFDEVFQKIAGNCIVYLLTGEAIEIPEDWLARVDVMDFLGEKILFSMSNKAANPDEVAEMLKKKYVHTFGKGRPKITEEHIEAADYLRMRWEGKSIAYLLEEEDIQKSQEGTISSRHSTATRKRHANMRAKISRLKKTIYRLVV